MKFFKNRMKEYEQITQNYLINRSPVIIRVDGIDFHTFTKGMKRPEYILQDGIERTAKYLCENIPGCQLAYVQSDEINLLLTDYETLNTEAWLEYNIQKLTSVTASMTTMAFEKNFMQAICDCFPNPMEIEDENQFEHCRILLEKACVGAATFDACAFNLPQTEVCNYFIWRQQVAMRSSLQMFAQSMLPYEELQEKNCSQLQKMMFQRCGFNWNDCSISEKRGTCIIKVPQKEGNTTRFSWYIDTNIPIFTQNREYIDKFVYGRNF